MLEDSIINFILDHEGEEYVNDPNDPGGETKWGISKKAFPDLDIRSITKDMAAEIYKKNYWYPQLNKKLSAVICDAAVNCGPSRAISWLQMVINKYIEPSSGGKLAIDGKLGPQTIAASNIFDENKLILCFNSLRIKYYLLIGNGNKSKFLNGWLNRVADLQILIALER